MKNERKKEASIVVRGVTYNHFGAFFQEKRCAADLTQGQTALALGYSDRQFISRIETGRVSLPIEKLRDVAVLFKLSQQELAEAVLEEQMRIIRARIDRAFAVAK